MAEQGHCVKETEEQKFSDTLKNSDEKRQIKQSCDLYSIQSTRGLPVLSSTPLSLLNYLASFSGSQSQGHQSHLLVTWLPTTESELPILIIVSFSFNSQPVHSEKGFLMSAWWPGNSHQWVKIAAPQKEVQVQSYWSLDNPPNTSGSYFLLSACPRCALVPQPLLHHF